MIQAQFINYLLESKDSSIIELNNLNEDYFSEYKGEMKFILTHLEKYGKLPDMETFLSVFQDFEVINVSEPSSYLIEELMKDYQTRKMADTFNKIRPLLMNGEIEKAMSIYKEDSENLHSGVALSCVDILQDTDERYQAYLERTQDYSKYFISTGFKEIDGIIGGIDREEELGVVVARTNLGKSWILDKMAASAALQGLKVGLYSGEMSEKKVGYRIDTILGHINNGSLIHGNANIQSDYKKYLDGLKQKGLSLKVLTPKMINGTAGVNALRMFIEKEHLDILFIDQLSLLEDDRKAKVPFEKASNISKDLKNLQVLKRIPIISVSQQNRTKNDEDEGDNIDTTQIAMSDRISQDATFILGITRDKKDNSIMTIHVVKSRDSANGQKVKYVVDFNKSEYTYIPEEEKKSSSEDAKNYESRYEEPVMDTPTIEDCGDEVF